MVTDPDHAFDCTIVRQSAGATIEEKVGLSIGSAEIEHPDLLLLAAREQIGRARGEGNTSDDMIVWEGLETLASVRVPQFAV